MKIGTVWERGSYGDVKVQSEIQSRFLHTSKSLCLLKGLVRLLESMQSTSRKLTGMLQMAV